MESMRDVLESFRSRPARRLKLKRAKPRKFKPSGGPWLDWGRLRIAQPPPPPEPARPFSRHGARHRYRPTTARYAQDGP